MKIIIHRGTNEIGGSCVEISTTTTRILIDIGLPLNSIIKKPEDLKQYYPNIDGDINAVFISHYHQDHHGLVSEIDPSIPVYVSAGTEKMFGINVAFMNLTKPENLQIIKQGTPVSIGNIKITAFTVDHSAYDAMAFLIEADGKRILYSGDIRTHGVKGRLYKDLPQNVDYLILEGTNIGKSTDKIETENDIKNQFAEHFQKDSDRINFIWCSGQNIDRLVTIYKACLISDKIFVPDLYVANVLAEVHLLNIKIPSPSSHPHIKVSYATSYHLDKHKDFAFRMRSYKIDSVEIAKSPEKYVVIVRPSMLVFMKKIDAAKANFHISLWKNYETKDENKGFFDWISQKGYNKIYPHTSGHADRQGLIKIVNHIKPQAIIPIHTQYKDKYGEFFGSVIVLEDKEVLNVV